MNPTACEDITRSLSITQGLRFSAWKEHQVDLAMIAYTATTWFVNFTDMILENGFWKEGVSVQKQEIRNLIGLKPQSHVCGSKIVKRQDSFCAILQSLVPSGTEISLGWPSKLSTVQPALPLLKRARVPTVICWLVSQLRLGLFGQLFGPLWQWNQQLVRVPATFTFYPPWGLYHISSWCWGQELEFLQLKTGRNRRKNMFKQLNPILPVENTQGN